jgi:Bacterial PH domain
VRDTLLGYGLTMAEVTAEVVRLYRSVWKSLLLFAGGLLFVMVGALIILSRGIFGWVVGGFTVGFFGLAAGYMAVEIVRRRPTVMMDHTGITVRTYFGAPGLIPWSEITGVRSYRIGRQRMLALDVVDESAVAARATPVGGFFARVNRGLGYPVVNVPQSAVAENLEDVVRYMRDFKSDLWSAEDDW